jgi:hypothetical protein
MILPGAVKVLARASVRPVAAAAHLPPNSRWILVRKPTYYVCTLVVYSGIYIVFVRNGQNF